MVTPLNKKWSSIENIEFYYLNVKNLIRLNSNLSYKNFYLVARADHLEGINKKVLSMILNLGVNFIVINEPIQDKDELVSQNPSFQHGSVIDLLVDKYIDKNVVSIILDPDFFIINKEYLTRLIAKMDSENLDLIGVNYPIQSFRNGLDFPTCYFIVFRPNFFVDYVVSFKPDTKQFVYHNDLGYKAFKNTSRLRKLILNRFSKFIFKYLKGSRLRNRLLILYSLVDGLWFSYLETKIKDVGYRVRDLIRKENLKIYLIKSVVHKDYFIESNFFFQKSWYLDSNEDLIYSKVTDPLRHFIEFGFFETRPGKMSPDFFPPIKIKILDKIIKKVFNVMDYTDISDSKVLEFFDFMNPRILPNLPCAWYSDEGKDLKAFHIGSSRHGISKDVILELGRLGDLS